MGKHHIEFDYTTGNSFHTEDIQGKILTEFVWEDLITAKENLQRIKEHYKWYEVMESSRSWGRREEEKEKNPPAWWDAKEGDRVNHNLLNLKLDNGKEVQFYPPWCGYFETLHAARIVSDESEMEFKL